MTPEERTELQRLAEQATPGEWRLSSDLNVMAPYPDGKAWFGVANCSSVADAMFVAAANPSTILSLLSEAAEREELRAENERLKTWIEDHQRRDERFHELQDPRVEALESRYQDLVNAARTIRESSSLAAIHPGDWKALAAALDALTPQPQGTDQGAQG